MLAEGGLFKEVRAKKLGWLVLIDPKKSNEDRRRQILTALVLFFLNLISSFLSLSTIWACVPLYIFTTKKRTPLADLTPSCSVQLLVLYHG